MPHSAKPFYKKSRGTWYVQLGPKQHNLGPDRDVAFRRYHELMLQQDAPVVQSDELQVCVVLDLFLDWSLKHNENRTFNWYRDYAQSFVSTLPPGPGRQGPAALPCPAVDRQQAEVEDRQARGGDRHPACP